MSLRDALLRDLAALVGETCWGAVCGEGSGTVLGLHIGARTPRSKPLRNRHLNELVRQYSGTYSMLIRCPWRIDSDAKVVAGSHMPNANDGPMVVGSQAICGQSIVAVNCSGPAFDLRLDFENRHALVVHCSVIGKDDEDCYAFGTTLGHYVVGLDGKLGFESRRTR